MQQRCIQVVCSNKEALLAKKNLSLLSWIKIQTPGKGMEMKEKERKEKCILNCMTKLNHELLANSAVISEQL